VTRVPDAVFESIEGTDEVTTIHRTTLKLFGVVVISVTVGTAIASCPPGAEVEREQAEFVNRVTTESFGRMLPVDTKQISLAHLMQHLANHSTYHRGQVALMMRQLAAEPLATDLAIFLMEGRRERADAQ
jgi:DinB family